MIPVLPAVHGDPAIRSCLYHAFPRRSERDSAHELEAGLRILESILQSGLLMVPESVSFGPELLDDDTWGEELYAIQRRFCLTLLNPLEVADHGRFFGRFAIAFEDDAARRLAAMPVMYIPRPVPGAVDVTQSALSIVHRLLEIQKLLVELSELEESQAAKAVTDALAAGKQPFLQLAGTIQALGSLFYPADRQRSDGEIETLAYYRQREWRITGHMSMMGERVETPLLSQECESLLALDGRFFSQEIDVRGGTRRRVDLCRYIREIAGTPVREMISSLQVPAAAEERAKELLRTYGLKCPVVSAPEEPVKCKPLASDPSSINVGGP